VCEPVHQRLQIGVELLRLAQMILRFLEEYADF
jgi:hypothetical protein